MQKIQKNSNLFEMERDLSKLSKSVRRKYLERERTATKKQADDETLSDAPIAIQIDQNCNSNAIPPTDSTNSSIIINNYIISNGKKLIYSKPAFRNLDTRAIKSHDQLVVQRQLLAVANNRLAKVEKMLKSRIFTVSNTIRYIFIKYYILYIYNNI